MLAEYYEAVWDRMRPHVAGRVLALVRCPDGVGGQIFYPEARLGRHGSQTRLHLVKEPDGEESISIDNVSGLVSLAQAGVLEVHVRGSTIEHLEEANRLVFDLDPGPGVDWKDVIAAAREVRERLADLKLKSFVKTTGGKGLHVVLPIRPAPWDEAKEFCRGIAERHGRRRSEALHRDDQESRRATTASSSTISATAARRPRSRPIRRGRGPGATVSVPLTWEELGNQKTPNVFTVLNLRKRLSRRARIHGRRWARMKQSLPPPRKRK